MAPPPGQIPSLEVVGARLQSCQARVVEAMQRCGALVQSIRRLCPPETQQQLQQHLPNVVIEQAHQSLIQVHPNSNPSPVAGYVSFQCVRVCVRRGGGGLVRYKNNH